ncbi:MAG: O-antigen ligase family protein [Spirochaetia bacterium]|nr:O-antigen ligase family protein [Spirochaetia bacterium]
MLTLGNYHLKLAYAGFLLAFFWVLIRHGRQQLTSLRQPWLLAFLAMGAAGFWSAIFFSIYPQRSIAINLWTVVTITSVPLMTALLLDRKNPWFARAVILFVLAQSMVIIYDFFISLAGHSSRVLGHVGEMQNFLMGTVVRPTAFRAEPGYYAASVLLWCLVIRVSLSKELSASWRRTGWAAWILGMISILLCGSRMGLIGLAVTLGFELLFLAFSLPVINQIRNSISRNSVRKIIKVFVVVLLAGCLALVFLKGRDFYVRFQEKIQKTGTDQTMAIRGYRLVAAMELFKERAWFGVGPGTAGAAFVASEREIPRSLMGRFLIDMADDPVSLSQNPLSHNLYTELLSEWGLFGALAFFLGLVLLVRPLPLQFFWTCLGILGVVYLSSETIARFDIWLALSTVVAFRGEPS